MENKTILICLEKLEVGGVETSVYNQALAFKEKGYNVIVLAKNGIYTERLKKHGIICIDFEFELKNEIDIKGTKQIIEIIKKYNVGQIHIHQFPCLLNAFIASIITKIPYIAFVHSRLTEVYDWYISNFPLYKRLFKFYFDNAYKIITLNYGSIDLNAKYFNIPKEKYAVLKNSIYFKEYISNTQVNTINNFMLISRIAPEKLISIQCGINFFIQYANSIENFSGKLVIYGDGDEQSVITIKNYIQEKNINNYNIIFEGGTNEVAKEMEKYDVVIGMGRCIIEAIATKRIAIITSPEEIKFLVDKNNIYNSIEANFASNDLEAKKIEDIILQLKNLDLDKIQKITEDNFNIALKELDILKNVYFIEDFLPDENAEIKILELNNIQIETLKEHEQENVQKYNLLLEEMKKQREIIDKITDYKAQEYNNIIQEIEELKNTVKKQEKKNEELFEELSSIYNSKRFKLINNIVNIFTRKRLK